MPQVPDRAFREAREERHDLAAGWCEAVCLSAGSTASADGATGTTLYTRLDTNVSNIEVKTALFHMLLDLTARVFSTVRA